MAVECVKNNAGTFLLILEETADGAYLCVFPDGTKRVMEEEQLDFDTYSEFADDDSRLTRAQTKVLSEHRDQEEYANEYDHHKRAA